MSKVKFKSKEFENYIKSSIGKEKAQELSIEEVDRIKELSYNPFYLDGKSQDFDIEDLLNFKNLEVCLIRNVEFENKDIQIISQLKNLKSLQINNCNFKRVRKKICNELEFLAVTNSKNFSLKLISPRERLECIKIINIPKFKLKGIENIQNISKLYLQDLKDINISMLNKRNDITYLNLDGSKLKNGKELLRLKDKMKIDYRIINMYI